jgi:cupin 2 domain-containing protein
MKRVPQKMPAPNLYRPLPDATAGEVVTTLLSQPSVRLERIVSHGQASPPGFWYDQPEGEWVIVLQGAARLELEGEGEVALHPGDHLYLPPHRRHRVTWTTPDIPTIWLALYLPATPARE